MEAKRPARRAGIKDRRVLNSTVRGFVAGLAELSPVQAAF
jgi:hypothetical protein